MNNNHDIVMSNDRDKDNLTLIWDHYIIYGCVMQYIIYTFISIWLLYIILLDN